MQGFIAGVARANEVFLFEGLLARSRMFPATSVHRGPEELLARVVYLKQRAVCLQLRLSAGKSSYMLDVHLLSLLVAFRGDLISWCVLQQRMADLHLSLRQLKKLLT